MRSEPSTLYPEVSAAFSRHLPMIDVQSDTMDVLQVVQAIADQKVVYMGMAEDAERADLYADVIALAAKHGMLTGSGQVNVHNRHRPFNIQDDEIVEALNARSKLPNTVYWLTWQKDIHGLFLSGDTTVISDSELLGYPSCCTAWHYDCFFARGTEALIDLSSRTTSRAATLSNVRAEWRALSGAFLPRAYYLAAILISNQSYPFIEHIACPNCVRSRASESAQINAKNSEELRELDPERRGEVVRFAAALGPRIAGLVRRPADWIEEDIGMFGSDVKARDGFTRQSRHLFKALGLADYRG